MHRSSWTAVAVATGLVCSAAALVAAPAGAADNGDLIVFTRAGDLWTVSPQGGEIRRLTHTDTLFESSPSWSPDGNAVRYVLSKEKGGKGEVWQTDLARNAARISPEGFFIGDVDWSPDGTRITYTRDLPTTKNQVQQDVFVAPADFTGPEQNLSNHPSRDGNPDFSSTGKIAFDSLRAGSSSSVWVADLHADGALHRVPTSDPKDGGSFPAWSPDGSQLVYMEYVNPTPNWGLRIFDGKVERRLTTGGGNEWDAEFSPDGREVVFAHTNGSPKEKFHIRRVEVAESADGAVSKEVTVADDVVSRQPSWRPAAAPTSGTTGSSPSPSPSPCVLTPLLPCG